jgi:pimeloyl-ACP methyl ester carboxylesterase
MSICFVSQGEEQMQRYRLQATGMLFPLLPMLFMFAACGSKPAPQQAAATPTPIITPTPTPTPPNVPHTPVYFTTQDHVQLAGLLYGAGRSTAIICSHEWRGTKDEWSNVAPWFAARGFMVLAYDFRGNGESQGLYDPSKEDLDLLAAIAFMHSHGSKQIILLGASMGADISLIVAAKTQVAGVITLSPEYLFGLSDNEIKAISAPKLFINSEVDSYAPDTRQMFQNGRPPKELHLYPGVAHGVAIFQTGYGQDLIARIISFANTYALHQ